MAQNFGTGIGQKTPVGIAAPPQTAFDHYVQQGMVSNAPALQNYANQYGVTDRNLAYGNAGYQNSQQAAQLGYTSDMRDLAQQQGENGINLGAAQRQPQLLDQLLGLDNKDFGIQKADASNTFNKNLYDLNSSATAAGSYGASGSQKQRGFLYGGLLNQLGHIDVSQQKNTLNSAESKAQAADRINTLQLQANRLGMKPDELKAQLSNGLAQLGLKQAMSVEDLLDGLSSNDLNAQQLKMKILSQAGQYAVASK